MPGMGGIDVVRKLRAVSTIPIIVLSAIGDEAQKVQALELGADDYMTKPFGMEELFARYYHCCGGPQARRVPLRSSSQATCR